MVACWSKQPSDRPTFDDLVATTRKLFRDARAKVKSQKRKQDDGNDAGEPPQPQQQVDVDEYQHAEDVSPQYQNSINSRY